jgi:hypothetical protein
VTLRIIALWILAAACLLPAGCLLGNRGGPEAPELSPDEAGEEAIKMYDTNRDGALDEQERKQSPALEMALRRIDQDQNGLLTAAEIADRVRYWRQSGSTIMSATSKVTLKGRPLVGATVTFEPEPFLGPSFKPSEGVTDQNGVAVFSGPDSAFPGIYLGFYKIRVSLVRNGRETIPAKYNEETVLGYEVSDDLPEMKGLIPITLD